MGSMAAFVDELCKLAAPAQVAEGGRRLISQLAPLTKQYGKPVGLMAGGALLYHLGSKEVDKYMLGRQVYEQMQAQGR